VDLNDNGGIGATWAFAQRAGQWSQEEKLVGAGEARKLASSVPPASDAALLGRSEDSGRVGAAATDPTATSRLGPIFCLGWKTLAEPV
jgi:hypothetical protein